MPGRGRALRPGVPDGGGRASTGEGYYTVRVSLVTVAPEEIALAKEARAFRDLADAFGLRPEWLGRALTTEGREVRIVGLKPRATRHPVVIEEIATGQRFVTAASIVREHLRAQAGR